MKPRIIAAFVALLLVETAYAAEEPVLKSQKEKINYLIGVDIGKNLKGRSVDVDLDALVLGMKDALAEKKPRLTEEEIKETSNIFNEEMKQKSSGKNRESAKEFLAKNMKKKGVVALPSGLQYKVIKEGNGKTPKAADMVTVHYRAALPDGKEFDNSYKRGQPATFRVNEAFPGWSEGLRLMKEGAKWQLFIPPNLAFAERDSGSLARLRNEIVIYDVELISVKEGPFVGGEKIK